MGENDKPKREWTVRQLAEAAGVSVSFVREQLATDKIPGRKIGPGLRGIWVVTDAAAQAWLQARKEQ